tara:strand:+ start:11195 stop:11422 length:228 start_codon:yes stop_codon:yes gene_type:complete
MSNNQAEQITNDEEPSVQEKYDKIMKQRKDAINKYHKTKKGKESLKASSVKYYAKHKAKILAKKRAKYRLDNPLK